MSYTHSIHVLHHNIYNSCLPLSLILFVRGRTAMALTVSVCNLISDVLFLIAFSLQRTKMLPLFSRELLPIVSPLTMQVSLLVGWLDNTVQQGCSYKYPRLLTASASSYTDLASQCIFYVMYCMSIIGFPISFILQYHLFMPTMKFVRIIGIHISQGI